MKLDEYVKQTLLEITNGVAEAQKESLLYIAPDHANSGKAIPAQHVKFEMVLQVCDEEDGLQVVSNPDRISNSPTEEFNRLTFRVPVYFQAPTKRNDSHFLHSKHD